MNGGMWSIAYSGENWHQSEGAVFGFDVSTLSGTIHSNCGDSDVYTFEVTLPSTE